MCSAWYDEHVLLLQLVPSNTLDCSLPVHSRCDISLVGPWILLLHKHVSLLSSPFPTSLTLRVCSLQALSPPLSLSWSPCLLWSLRSSRLSLLCPLQLLWPVEWLYWCRSYWLFLCVHPLLWFWTHWSPSCTQLLFVSALPGTDMSIASFQWNPSFSLSRPSFAWLGQLHDTILCCRSWA